MTPPGPSPVHPYREATEARREGELLRVRALMPSLPPRCVVCNAPQAVRTRQTLATSRRSLSLVLLLGFFSAPTIPVFVEFGLCAEHARRRRRALILARATAAAGFVAMVSLVLAGSRWAPIGLLIALAAWAVGERRRAIVRVARHDETEVLLTVPGPFLESFQERGGARARERLEGR